MNTNKIVTNPITGEKVPLQTIFAAVDESNQRFEKYTPEERQQLRESMGHISKARATALARQIWDVVPSED